MQTIDHTPCGKFGDTRHGQMRLPYEQEQILLTVNAQCIHGREIVYTSEGKVEQCFTRRNLSISAASSEKRTDGM